MVVTLVILTYRGSVQGRWSLAVSRADQSSNGNRKPDSARKLAPKDGDVLHGLAKAHISLVGDALSVEEEALQGWQNAEAVWLEAIDLAPSHPELALKKLRLQNYYPFPLGVQLAFG